MTNVNDNEALGNSKVLNVVLNGVGLNMFRSVNACNDAKDAWEIIKISHEDTSKVGMSWLQLSTIKSKNLRVNEDESIFDFNIKLCDIDNTSFVLGKKMSKDTLSHLLVFKASYGFSAFSAM